ncbi:polyamine aminopropyltransferase [Haloferula sargassicola]|uniref:Polyamine aminopropyltransferase n=2 Tax=Haloferula sargassicola TaxID=490096 RepID=A0ABP9URK3_9BACT
MGYKRIATTTTGHQSLEIWSTCASCEFRVAGAVHAWWHRDRFLTGLAWDNLAAAALLRPDGPPRSVLMLGLAGGTTPRILRQLVPEVEITAVDLDPAIIELAREHMRLDDTGMTIHIADAYEWAAGCGRTFDVVIDDCYLAGEDDVFRPERQPERLIETLRPLLAPGGLLLANLVTGPGHRRLQTRMRAAFRRAFPEVRSVTTPDSLNETLAGGGKVATGAVLDRWTADFPMKKDRDFWRRIGVRLL